MAEQQSDDWHSVAATGDLEDGDMKQIIVAGRRMALFRVDGDFYATSDVCTHAFAFLTQGYLEDFTIECPLHQGCYDIRTGKALSAPVTVDIPTFPVKVDGEEVLIAYTPPPKKEEAAD